MTDTTRVRIKAGCNYRIALDTLLGAGDEYDASPQEMAAFGDKFEVVAMQVANEVVDFQPAVILEQDGESMPPDGNLLDVALELGVIERRGSYYYWNDVTLARGRDAAAEAVNADPAITDAILQAMQVAHEVS